MVRNPLLMSTVPGLVVALMGMRLPVALGRFLVLLGGTATPCRRRGKRRRCS